MSLKKLLIIIILNVGSGEEISIRKLAENISNIIGFKGELVFDLSMPDGTPRKLLNSDKIKKLGWKPKFSLLEGLKKLIKIILNKTGFIMSNSKNCINNWYNRSRWFISY